MLIFSQFRLFIFSLILHKTNRFYLKKAKRYARYTSSAIILPIIGLLVKCLHRFRLLFLCEVHRFLFMLENENFFTFPSCFRFISCLQIVWIAMIRFMPFNSWIITIHAFSLHKKRGLSIPSSLLFMRLILFFN